MEWKQNDYLELKKHANYWRKGVPAWDRMVAKVVPEDAARVAYLMTNQAQIISSPPPREFERLKTAPGIATGSKVAIGGMWFMQTNTKRAPFDDINFRKAVSCAIDRQKIAKDVFYGLLDPTAVPAPTGVSYHNAEAEKTLSYDPAKAKEYLAKSKYAANAGVRTAGAFTALPDRFRRCDRRDAIAARRGRHQDAADQHGNAADPATLHRRHAGRVAVAADGTERPDLHHPDLLHGRPDHVEVVGLYQRGTR